MDPLLGPEMRSTGEVMGTGASFGEAFYKAELGANTPLPVNGTVFISVNDYDKHTILPAAQKLNKLGIKIKVLWAISEGSGDSKNIIIHLEYEDAGKVIAELEKLGCTATVLDR